MNDKKESFPQKKTKVIDWYKIYRRIEIDRAAIEQGLQPTKEERDRILTARTKKFAVAPERKIDGEETIEVVEFVLAHEKYAVESEYVREIYPLHELTPIPCTPSFVLGIINVRGQILSVIDIKKFFDLPEKGLTDLNKVIIAHTDKMELGILADVIIGTRAIPLVEIQPPPPTLTGIHAEYLKGITGERLIVLDITKILSDDKIIVHEEA